MAKRIKLREYQKKCIDAIEEAPDGKYLIALATGLGKTVIFTKMPKQGRTLILSHRDELVRQPLKYMPTEICGVEKAGEHAPENATVVSASVQTLSKDSRLTQYDPNAFTTIICDEAHHSVAPTYKKVLDYFSGAKKILGFTATPQRGDKVGLSAVYDKILFSRDLRWGIEHKYLAPIRCIEVDGKYSLKGVKRIAGDYSAKDLERVMADAHIYTVAAKAYLDFCHSSGRHTLIFTVTTNTAQILLKSIRALLPKKEQKTIQMVTGKTDPEERRKILEDFNEGKVRCIVNCMVLTEGTDLPICDCIMNLRPTASPSLYQQMVGRGTRIFKGKKNCLVIDVTPDDSRSRTLCTAPTLFGLDPELLNKKDKQRITSGKEDLLGLCDEIAATVMAGIRSVELFVTALDRMVNEREAVILSMPEGEKYSVLMDKLREYGNGNAKKENDFGNLYVEQTANADHRYRIKPNFTDEIFISEPDIMDESKIEFHIRKNGVTEIYAKRLPINDAIRAAKAYCIRFLPGFTWNTDTQVKWRNEPATDAQKYTLDNIAKEYPHLNADGLDKLTASFLIDYLMQLKADKKNLKQFSPVDTDTPKTIEKKRAALQDFMTHQEAGTKDVSAHFQSFADANERELAAYEKKQKHANRHQQICTKQEDGSILVQTEHDSSGNITESQLKYLKTLFNTGRENNIQLYATNNQIRNLSVAEAGILIFFISDMLYHHKDELVNHTVNLEDSIQAIHSIRTDDEPEPFVLRFLPT